MKTLRMTTFRDRTTLNAVYSRLTNWKQNTRYGGVGINGYNGIAFTNVGKDGPNNRHTLATDAEKDNRDKLHITCYNYQKKGHYADECRS